ncbi:Hypothetical protein PHPALM_37169 [Phytophthora palmivora]|uniref:Uncharacterized protein n=1 Tax=Phytophthora palmivora TaxID=4796 RepID=A0A2P4WY40_9STRA|nr:Hypothetical protein PHPALM_37169 [Phytophthora palmivora]
MSEDEFVVLLEHAGILETSDENDMEFMEETVLREWLERDGVQLFTTQMTTSKREQSDTDLVVDGNASTAPTATATATTLEWKTKLYTPRLRTNEAYRIYIEKDNQAVHAPVAD